MRLVDIEIALDRRKRDRDDADIDDNHRLHAAQDCEGEPPAPTGLFCDDASAVSHHAHALPSVLGSIVMFKATVWSGLLSLQCSDEPELCLFVQASDFVVTWHPRPKCSEVVAAALLV